MAAVNPVYDREGEHIGWKVSVRKKGFPAQYRTFRTKAEALEWSTVIESEMVRGVWRDRSEAERTTLADCITRYMDEIIPQKKGGDRELGFLRQWQKRSIAKRFMASIEGHDVAAAIKEMEAEGKAPKTINLHLGVLRHLFNVARQEWRMSSITNPVELVRKPKLPQGRDRRLVDDEESRLLDACEESQTPWLRPVVIFAVETAMRSGEMLETWRYSNKEKIKASDGLQWSDVDLVKRTAHLPKTKNGEARTVPLSSRAIQILRDLPHNLDGRVFGTTYEGIHQAYARACKRACIEDLRFHDLRHEATSRLFEKGFNPVEVSAITGHKTLQMLKRYTHLKAEDLAKRMD
ncbi:site-specific integrase [Acidithiobacillus thiooxidans]|uniref:site-specific integrase n=1 Tax=Acidithiobacillus TaxID=119977 RepID=UPI001C066F6D|nr:MULTISPECIES: site-specific integrase [Acidithiobacillus]MBU2740221.1 site-specific integrase [Acidithiobacillus albertensis]MBU2793364.1 site-specific integrase [Acidithiobacillus thiooxidans]